MKWVGQVARVVRREIHAKFWLENLKGRDISEYLNVCLFQEFEVLTPVVMKSSVFWELTPYSPLKVNKFSEEHIASIFRVEE
jgi:hypothetical protein